MLQVKAATVMRQLQEKGAEFRALEPTGDIRHILATTLFNSFFKGKLQEQCLPVK